MLCCICTRNVSGRRESIRKKRDGEISERIFTFMISWWKRREKNEFGKRFQIVNKTLILIFTKIEKFLKELHIKYHVPHLDDLSLFSLFYKTGSIRAIFSFSGESFFLRRICSRSKLSHYKVPLQTRFSAFRLVFLRHETKFR